MSADKKTCFIIMPITTPETHIELYRDGTEHFQHVLDCLHKVAVDKAEFEPIPPKVKGGGVIQVEIIRNLETADLVLCDISTFNPNVFFELGVRTSLNKPVCLVKDEHTEKPPFDIGPINQLGYRSSLDPWDLKNDIAKMIEHIKASYYGSENENSLWRGFALKSEAKSYEKKAGAEGQLDEILFRLNFMNERIEDIDSRFIADVHSLQENQPPTPLTKARFLSFKRILTSSLPSSADILNIHPDWENKIATVIHSGTLGNDTKDKIKADLEPRYGITIAFSKS